MNEPKTSTVHVPVLPTEAIESLQILPSGVYLDGTIGGGGHTSLITESLDPTGLVIGLDRDAQALSRCESILAGRPVLLVQSNFSDTPEVLLELKIPNLNGIILDLGLSSDQLEDEQRGFSFNSTGPLDLRFDPERGEPAWRLIQRLRPEHLADLIYKYGEERLSRRIARKLCAGGKRNPLIQSDEIAAAISSCYPKFTKSRIHPATRTFQALRIAVNDELKSLEIALRRLPSCLAPGARLCIISFHSLEDRRVKHAFRQDPRLEVITRRPITATAEEIQANPRSRSAKLRVAERTDEIE